jgi:hypothetical protein
MYLIADCSRSRRPCDHFFLYVWRFGNSLPGLAALASN